MLNEVQNNFFQFAFYNFISFKMPFSIVSIVSIPDLENLGLDDSYIPMWAVIFIPTVTHKALR